VIPIAPEPTIPRIPTAPNLADQLPPVIVITPKDATYYATACEAWDSGDTEEEMHASYPGLSRSAACDWAIYGYTVQGQLTAESILAQQATYAEQLRSYIQLLIGIIHTQQQISQDTRKSIEALNQNPPVVSKAGFTNPFW